MAACEFKLEPDNTQIVGQEQKKSYYAKSMVCGLCAGIFVTIIFVFHLRSIQEIAFEFYPFFAKTQPLHIKDELKIKSLKNEIVRLKKQNEKLIPSNLYLVINSSTHQFTLMQGEKIVRQGICSTGSNILLKAHDKRSWLFKTPKGLFLIKNKIVSPIWRMPDWAFVEEGKPVPPPTASERFDYGALGDYAFDIGHGFLLHGTLYQRLLGMPVTHGCVRFGDDDLKFLFQHLSVGSNVFIY